MRPIISAFMSAGILLFAIAAATAQDIKVLFLGDSITAGLGVEQDQAYPFLVDQLLKEKGIPNIAVINAGISGSTTASAPSRLKWHLKAHPQILFLALGANDGLRGLSTDQMRLNLDRTIALALEHHITVILAGMEIPPNYGPGYTAAFRQVFKELAEKHPVKFVPFLLEGVGGVAGLNQADGIHPNARGHEVIAQTVLPFILECL